MFFKKKDKKTQVEGMVDIKVKLELIEGSTLKKQLQMLNLTEKDLQYLKAFKPYVDENIDNIVTIFYRNLDLEA